MTPIKVTLNLPDWARAERAFRGIAEVALIETKSQIGSGALPISLLPSTALALRPLAARSGSAVECLARDLRAMPIPVIGRIEGGRVILDLRCLENETAFIAQLDPLVLKKGQCVLRDGRVAASSG